MKRLTAKWRWILLLTAFTAVGAALHAQDSATEFAVPSKSSAARAESGRVPAPRDSRAAVDLPRVQMDRFEGLKARRKASAASADPFLDDHVAANAAAAAASVVTPPPAPPQAPPPPFRFIGAQEIDGVLQVFLEQQGRTHIARAGEVIADGWRLDKLTERAVIFTYVPLGQERSIQIGGAG